MPKQMHPSVLAEKLQAGEPVYLLDVRQQWEHDYANIAGDVLIPLHELGERVGEVNPPAGATVVVYCHHGMRSLSGAAILEAKGFGECHSLSGGIEAWSQLIDPTVRRYG